MSAKSATEAQVEIERTAALLGGRSVLGRRVRTQIDAHDILVEGLPGRALTTFIASFVVFPEIELEKALGMSLRTVQRVKASPTKVLDPDQSARTWKLASILAKATDVFGSQEAAENWLERPATGLDRRRPIDLLATPAGAELVEQFLTRLDYGVYT